MAVTVTRKGQVTIPKPVRDRLGINPGSKVDFEVSEDGRAYLRRVRQARPEAKPLRADARDSDERAHDGGDHGVDPRRELMTLVDTNVLLDLATNDPEWAAWSLRQLDAAAIRGPVLINAVVYAEFSIGYARIEEVDSVLDDVGLKLVEAPRPALFLAGKAFQRYRAQGGPRTSVLPDFFIGAHAAVGGFLLLTRDARRYRAYFPGVELIAPDETDRH